MGILSIILAVIGGLIVLCLVIVGIWSRRLTGFSFLQYVKMIIKSDMGIRDLTDILIAVHSDPKYYYDCTVKYLKRKEETKNLFKMTTLVEEQKEV